MCLKWHGNHPRKNPSTPLTPPPQCFISSLYFTDPLKAVFANATVDTDGDLHTTMRTFMFEPDPAEKVRKKLRPRSTIVFLTFNILHPCRWSDEGVAPRYLRSGIRYKRWLKLGYYYLLLTLHVSAKNGDILLCLRCGMRIGL